MLLVVTDPIQMGSRLRFRQKSFSLYTRYIPEALNETIKLKFCGALGCLQPNLGISPYTPHYKRDGFHTCTNNCILLPFGGFQY